MVLIPLVSAGILYLPTDFLALVLAAVVLVAAVEMGRLANLGQRPQLAAYVVSVGGALLVAWLYLAPSLVIPLQWLVAAWWLVVTLGLLLRRSALPRIDGRRPLVLLLGAAVLVSAWLSLVVLHGARPNGPGLLLFLFVLIWVADSAAYFAGRAFGSRKLAPFVSPGKTWAGAVGAAAGALLCGVALHAAGLAGSAAPWTVALLCVLVTLVSIGGDLWESRLKREAGVKDSGSLLPGHGGMLDRIDSLLAAAPVFGLGVGVIGMMA